MTQAAFQQAFWQSLWCEPGAVAAEPWVMQPGYTVYRNTVLKACVDNLLAMYPALRRLAGEDWLRATALAYARHNPPTDGRLHAYGEGLTVYMQAALPPGEWPWLPKVAHLDWLWSQSHTSADADCLLPAQILARAHTLDTNCDAADLVLQLHPAARWYWCGDWPVFSLWQAAREAFADANPPHWRGQGVLLTRPHGAVLACELSQGGCALLEACSRHESLAQALSHGLGPEVDQDPAVLLGQLITQGAFRAMTS